MIIIDDNMFRLAKMQETLLKVSTSDREANLEKYKKTVAEIDAKAFSDVLEEMRHLNEHNHSVESELEFLLAIQAAYNQLLQLQNGFKKVCELYGGSELELSDLSRLNIEAINNRISAIQGYLTNLDNIRENEERAKKLTERIAEELKTKEAQDRQLLELERTLRESFLSTEGRCVVDGRLVRSSIVIEYEKIDLDIRMLLSNPEVLEQAYQEALEKRASAYDTLEATKVCHINSNGLVDDIKQFLDTATNDYYRAEYKLTMIKILRLLAEDRTEYDHVVDKRNDILKLIEHRYECLEQLGVFDISNRDIEPFSRTSVSTQLKDLGRLNDNSKVLSSLRKELDELMDKIDQMVSQKKPNQDALSATRSALETKISMRDIDISDVDLPASVSKEKKETLPNQVVSVRNALNMNMYIVGQKTKAVIGRVNQMVNKKTQPKVESHISLVPELVIVPSVTTKVEDKTETPVVIDDDAERAPKLVAPVIEPDSEEYEEDEAPVLFEDLPVASVDDDLFQTVIPFSQPKMFSERSDDVIVADTPKVIEFSKKKEETAVESTLFDEVDEMPDAFWVTQSGTDDEVEDFEEEETLSFDDQIDKLLSTGQADVKVRKKVA